MRKPLQSRHFKSPAHYQHGTHTWLTCDIGVEGDDIPSQCLEMIDGKCVCQWLGSE